MKTFIQTVLFAAATLPLSFNLSPEMADAAQVKTVTFESNGQTLVGDLYLPDNYTPGQVLPGVVVTGSWTSVKEQMAGLYAGELADRGFAALAFDFRNFGQSEGDIRGFESPEMKIQDIRAAAEFLPTLPEVADDKVGGLAICASAGYMAHAIARSQPDRTPNPAPFESFVTIAPWFHNAETARAIYTSERYDRLIEASQQAAVDYAKDGTVQYTVAATNDEDVDLAAMRWADPNFYYTNPERGAIPEYDNRFPVMAWEGWLTFDALAAAEGINVPFLMIHGDQMALPENARAFYAEVEGPKSIEWLEGFQMDYYDQPELVGNAADLAAGHFNQTLYE